MRRRWVPWRLWTRWNARADRRRDLPAPESTGIGEVERQIQAAVNAGIRNAEQQYAAKVDPLRAERTEAETALGTIYRPEYFRLREKVGRHDVRILIPWAAHLALLALLTVGEMAFNLVAFNVFQEPAFYTALMALAIGVAVPLCAWGIGVWVRQWPAPWWATLTKIVVVASALVAVLIGINQVRLAYLREQAPEFAGAHPELGLAFFAVNIVILVAAALVTYLAHDPEPGFAEAKAKYERCQRRLRMVEGRLDQLANGFRTETEILKESGWQLIAFYRMINRRGRKQWPRYFDDVAEDGYRPEFVDVWVGRPATGPQAAQRVERVA